jgi:hypothetical protein
MNETTNIHDKFFKEAFSKPEIKRQFVSHYLPKRVIESPGTFEGNDNLLAGIGKSHS